jgi:hypothetical protein
MTPEKENEIEARFDLPFQKINYLINIDEKLRVVYLETPKIACTSIKKYMIDQASGFPVDMKPGQVHDRSQSPLRMLGSYSDEQINEIFDPKGGYRCFSFVRDPYTRILSAFLDKVITNEWERKRHLPIFGFELGSYPSFGEFLKRLARIADRTRDIHYITQTRLTGHFANLELAFTGRFENFANDLQRLKFELYRDGTGENYESFGKHHSSDAGDKLAQYYGDEERELVQQIYADDFKLYGYPV